MVFHEKIGEFDNNYSLGYGIEMKIQDVFMLCLNLIIIFFCLVIYLFKNFRNSKKKQNSIIPVGPLCHLCVYFQDLNLNFFYLI